MSIRVGVIGAGVLGRHHIRLYQQSSLAKLVGIYDKNPQHAETVAKEFQTQMIESLEQLFPLVEAVSIAVPTTSHYSIARDALLYNCHALIEKPLTATAQEGRELIQLAKEKNLILHVGHVENYNPVIQYLRERLTRPLFIEAHRLAPYPPPRPDAPPRGTEVSVVHDLMIHDLDLILNLVNSQVTSIDAIGMPVLSPTADIANTRIHFQNGCIANITASRISPERMRKIRVFQENVYYSLDYEHRSGEIHYRSGQGIIREQVPCQEGNALQQELETFLRVIAHFKKHREILNEGVSGERALKALELADQIEKQISDRLKERSLL